MLNTNKIDFYFNYPIQFNRTVFDDMGLLIHEFDKIVVLYQQCELKMFREFAEGM